MLFTRLAAVMLMVAVAARAQEPDLPPAPRPPAPYAPNVPVPFGPGFARGVVWPSPGNGDAGWGTPAGLAVLERLRKLGADSVAFCPKYVVDWRSPFAIHPFPGAADRDALKAMIGKARSLGMQVVIRPQLESWDRHRRLKRRFVLKTGTREDWADFFQLWEDKLVPLAQLAEQTGCQALSLGTRLFQLTRTTPANFAILAGRLRAHFRGALTYDAHWKREVHEIPFWSSLDIISVTLYQPLGDNDDQPPSDVKRTHLAGMPTEQLSDLWYHYKKPVWISEVGFPANPEGADRPFQWLLDSKEPAGEQQADLIHESLLMYQDKRWLSGMFVHGLDGPGGPADPSYNPMGKPAEGVLSQFFPTGPKRDERYYRAKELVPWMEDHF